MTSTFPRLFCIVATQASVAAVFWRGRKGWWHIGRWDFGAGTYQPGAWYRGKLYPQRCDVSPCGRWLACFTLNPATDWKAGTTYTAVANLPWLTALAAWEEIGTWTRGIHFEAAGLPNPPKDQAVFGAASGAPGLHPFGRHVTVPTVGNVTRCLLVYGLRNTLPMQFATEQRRGWSESKDTAPREQTDYWDEHRDLCVERPRPGNSQFILRARGRYAAFRQGPNEDHPSNSFYELAQGEHKILLEDAAWADWGHDGRLLVATRDGHLQIRDVGKQQGTVFDHDLSCLRPAPCPAPKWAKEWHSAKMRSVMLPPTTSPRPC